MAKADDFNIHNSISFSASGVTGTVQLPYNVGFPNINNTLLITNESTSNNIKFKLGDASVTCDSDGTTLLFNNSMYISRNNNTHIAILATSGTASVSLTCGDFNG